MALEALYTITSPNATVARIVRKSIQSVLSLAIRSFPNHSQEPGNQALKFASPVLKILKLIEAGAGRSQQDGFSGTGRFACITHRGFQRPALHRRNFSVQMILNFIGRGSD